MGANTDYLGHIEIVPNLNQAEYNYLHAFANSRRGYRPGGGPTPTHPRTRTPEAALERWSATTRLPRDNLATGANGCRAHAAAAWLERE